MLINGFLGLCSAVSVGACTELTAPGYARQPIQFATPKNVVSFSSIHYTFGHGLGAGVGRAIWDAPTGGNLLLVLPLVQPPPLARPVWDSGDVGMLRLVLPALALYQDGAAYYGTIAAATVCGTCNDIFDVVNAIGIISGTAANPAPVINTAPLSSGVALTIARGELRAVSVAA